MATAEEAKAIVAILNGAPFDLNITILEFCQKSPSQLRQLLFYVLSAIVPPQKLKNSSESTTCWMMETLTILDYHLNIDGFDSSICFSPRTSLREGISSGNPDIIHFLLLWLLPQINMLQKRAYLVQILVDVEIPTELLLGEDISKLYSQYNIVREEFLIIHKQLESLRQIERDPVKVKEQVVGLEIEREHLEFKVSKLKNRLQDVDKSNEMLQVVGELKTQKLEEIKLAKLICKERRALTCTLEKHQNAYSKLQRMESLLDDANHAALFDKTSQEICVLRLKAKLKLPEELAAKEVHLCALQQVLSGPNKYEGMANIQSKLLAVNEELKRRNDLEKHTRIDKASKRESFHWQQTQMGIIIANMLHVAKDKIAALTQCRNKLQRDLYQTNMTIEEVKAIVLRGDDFKNYVDALRAKSAMYKEMKTEIVDLDSKYGALLKNQELLEQQIHMHPQLPTDHDDQASNGKQSGAKNLRKMIEEVNTSIKDIRSQLTPQIKELKLLRADLQALEAEKTEKKQHYSDICSLFDRKISKLEMELALSCKKYEEEERKLTKNILAIEKLEVSHLQMNVEKEDHSISTKLKFKIEEQEELLKSVQHKQQKIKETKHINCLQMVMMKDLLALITAKLSLYLSSSRLPIFSTAATFFETVLMQSLFSTKSNVVKTYVIFHFQICM